MNKVFDQVSSSNRIEITFQSFLLFSVASVVAVPLAMNRSFSWSNLLIFISIGISITVITGVFIFITLSLLKGFLQNLEPGDHFFAMLIVMACSGAVRGFLLYLSFDLGGFTQPTELHLRVITSTATTVFWLASISLVVQDAQIFKKNYTSILKKSILRIAGENSEKSEDKLSGQLSEELRQIESALNQTFDEAIRSTVSRESLLYAALKVRQTVDQQIRPLSHRLWLDEFNKAPKIRLWTTLVQSIKYLKIRALPIAFFLTLISAFNLTSDFGATRGLIGSITVFVVSYFSFLFIDRFLIHDTNGKFLRNFLYLLIPGTLLGAVIFVTNKYIFKNDTGLISFVYIGLNLIVAVMSSTRELSKSDRNTLLLGLQKNLSGDATSNLNTGHSNVEVASFLHNSLQSELLALAYQLEELANKPNSSKSRELLEYLGSRINRTISRDFEDFMEDPWSRLEKITAAWRGIVKISLLKDDFTNFKPEKALLMVQIIEEAISNAVRYAEAKNISISIKNILNDQIEVSISNDGMINTKGKSGLGTDWLDRYAAGKWSREVKDGETVLLLIL